MCMCRSLYKLECFFSILTTFFFFLRQGLLLSRSSTTSLSCLVSEVQDIACLHFSSSRIISINMLFSFSFLFCFYFGSFYELNPCFSACGHVIYPLNCLSSTAGMLLILKMSAILILSNTFSVRI